LPNISFYVVSKFALEGYTAATLAAELADKNVLVNSLSPGMVDTQSFPKAPGKEGVRTAESVRDGLMTILGSGVTGHYLHVDELDQVRAKGLADAVALKPNQRRHVLTVVGRGKLGGTLLYCTAKGIGLIMLIVAEKTCRRTYCTKETRRE
jgi:hypothetical protein